MAVMAEHMQSLEFNSLSSKVVDDQQTVKGRVRAARFTAVMTEQKDIDDLGPIGIVLEALKIFRTHVKAFVLIQLPFMLGLAALSAVGLCFLFWGIPGQLWGPTGALLLMSNFGLVFNLISPVGFPAITVLVPAVVGIIFQAALCLPISATVYLVGLHYAGQPVSFFDAIRAPVPRLWMRLTVTRTYYLLLAVTILLLPDAVIAIWLKPMHYDREWLTDLLLALSLTSQTYLSVINVVASGVAVLDEDYGWAAMNKGMKLMIEGKLTVSIGYQALLLVPGFVLTILGTAFNLQFNHYDYSGRSLPLLVLTAVVWIVFTTFTWQLTALCSGIQYVSFNAYHDRRSIADDIYQKRTAKEEKRSTADGIYEAVLGGQTTGSNNV